MHFVSMVELKDKSLTIYNDKFEDCVVVEVEDWKNVGESIFIAIPYKDAAIFAKKILGVAETK